MYQPAAAVDSDQPSSSSSSTAAIINIPRAATADGYEILKPYNAKAQARDCYNCIFFLIFLLLLVGAVPGVTQLLIYLQPSLPTVAVLSSAVTVKNVSGSLVTASWDVTFSISNPNDKGLFYDRLVAYAAAAADGRVANVTLPPFRQAAGANPATLSASFPSLKFVVDDCAANRTILRPCGPTPLGLQLAATAVYERWTWPEKANLVQVECDVMEVIFRPHTTKLEMGPASCRSDGEWRRLKEKCWNIFLSYVFVAGMCLLILSWSQ